MNILFICKHNRFRSKVAEALFRHHYKGEKVQVKSAAIILDMIHPYMGRSVVHLLRDRGVLVRDDGARKMDPFVLNWADRVIIVADNVAPEYIKNKPIAIWPISDVSEGDLHRVALKVNEIEKRVLELIKEVG